MIGYITHPADEPLSLYSGAFELRSEGDQVAADGSVLIRWFPRPELVFRVSALELAPLRPIMDRFVSTPGPPLAHHRLEDPLGHYRSERRIDSFYEVGGPGRFQMDFGLNVFERKEGSKIDEVVFHIVNLTGLYEGSVNSGSYSSIKEFTVNGTTWKIALRSTGNRRSAGDWMKSSPKFAVTHVGIIEKQDRTEFGTDDATDLLDGLYYFLSFVRGAWCWPCVYIGLRSSEFQWMRCEQPKEINQLKEDHDFSFTGNKTVLCESFDGFLEFWNDPDWRTPLKTAMSWAIDGRQSRLFESSIVGGQTALELISWVHLVDGQKVLSAEGFDKLPAADRLRLMLKLQKIPTTLSSTLAAYCAQRKWEDGPRLLTELRNSIIHPKRREMVYKAPEAVREQARTLTESYLSSTLLRLFGYSGELPQYRDR